MVVDLPLPLALPISSLILILKRILTTKEESIVIEIVERRILSPIQKWFFHLGFKVKPCLKTSFHLRFVGCNIPRPNPIVNVNENVLKLVICLISFCMHLSWHSARMYCAVK
jgi:hypothetical protein